MFKRSNTTTYSQLIYARGELWTRGDYYTWLITHEQHNPHSAAYLAFRSREHTPSYSLLIDDTYVIAWSRDFQRVYKALEETLEYVHPDYAAIIEEDTQTLVVEYNQQVGTINRYEVRKHVQQDNNHQPNSETDSAS